MASQDDPDELIGSAEVAALVGFAGRDGVSRHMSRFPGFHEPVCKPSDGRRYLWVRREIGAWVETRKVSHEGNGPRPPSIALDLNGGRSWVDAWDRASGRLRS